MRIGGSRRDTAHVVDPAGADAGLKIALEKLNGEIAELLTQLDSKLVQQKLDSALSVLSRYMTEYAIELNVEHVSEVAPLRLDTRQLTAVVDTTIEPIPLQSIGSGDNWVGIHLAVYMGLHRLFAERNRPVPSFIVLDQPSQAHYPPERAVDWSPETELDDDRRAVRHIFEILRDFANGMSGQCQVIVVDHAEYTDDWFQSAIVARWRDGEKLIPESWIHDPNG